jgi:hypothetical protein
MIEVFVCPNCGTQFESRGPGTRCPVCNTRGKSRERRGSGAAYFFSSNGGFRSMTWGGGRGLLLAVLSALLAPVLLSSGLVALAIGAIFDVSFLVTLGLVMMTMGLVLFVFFLWKLVRGLRSAARTWNEMSGAAHQDDDGRVTGRWQ